MAATNDEIAVGQSLGRPPSLGRFSIPLLLSLSAEEEPLSSPILTLDREAGTKTRIMARSRDLCKSVAKYAHVQTDPPPLPVYVSQLQG